MGKINKYLVTTKRYGVEKMQEVNLSKGEYKLLLLMANNKETTLDEMLKTVYEDNEFMQDDYQSMRVRIFRLRKKRI